MTFQFIDSAITYRSSFPSNISNLKRNPSYVISITMYLEFVAFGLPLLNFKSLNIHLVTKKTSLEVEGVISTISIDYRYLFDLL
jgi:hypothetical protein